MTRPMDRRNFLRTAGGVIVAGGMARQLLGAQVSGSPVLRSVAGEAEPVTLAAGGLQLDLTVQSGGPVVVRSLRNSATGFEWARAGAVMEPLVIANGVPQAGSVWQTHATGSTPLGDRLECTSDGSTAGGPSHALNTTLAMQAVRDAPFVEWRAELHNAGTGAVAGVERFSPLRVSLRADLGPLRVYAFPKAGPVATQTIAAGATLKAPLDVVDNGDIGPLVVIEAVDHGEFLVVGMEWDLGVMTRIQDDADGRWLTMSAGGLTHAITPGERLPMPPVFLGTMRTGPGETIDEVIQRTQRYLKQYVFPKPRPGSPWVVYDLWGTEPQGVEDTIRKEIAWAAEMGVELFYVDASWYKGSDKQGGGNWGSGLGNYEEDREKYPRGLAAMSRDVHEAGMKFGLWVGPSAVDGSLVGRQIPEEWLVDLQGGAGMFNLRSVCLGCPGYAEYVKENLTRIVREFSLDWLKWDSTPGVAECTRADHGHQAGDGLYAVKRNKYAIYEHLHREYPDLVIEQCQSTGELEYGPGRSIRAIWLSDSTFPSSNVRHNAIAASYLYPSAYNGAWIVRPDPELGDAADSDAHLDTMYRSRMIGAFGFGCAYGSLEDRVSLLPERVLAAARRNIPVYKRYRHLLYADCHHLTPLGSPPDLWQSIQFVSTAKDESVVLTFRADSPRSKTQLTLRGLAPSRTYEITSVNTGRKTRLRGDALMRDGVPLSLDIPNMSEVLLLRGR